MAWFSKPIILIKFASSNLSGLKSQDYGKMVSVLFGTFFMVSISSSKSETFVAL